MTNLNPLRGCNQPGLAKEARIKTPSLPTPQWLSQKFSLPQHGMVLILLMGLLNGLLYTFLIPAWWHYDEPGHFEYVWVILHKTALPSMQDVDETMRQELAASLEEYRFYEFQSAIYRPQAGQPAWIGIPQLVNLPLYYWYVSLPLRLFPCLGFAAQNYLIRLATLGLMLATLQLSHATMKEVTLAGHPLRWMIPAFLALLPGFVELMTSISDDAGAVFTFSVFLLFATRLIVRGFQWRSLAGMLLGVAMCLLTKNTVWISLPAAGLVLLFTLLRGRWQWAAWALGGLAIALGLLLSIRWGDAASWFPANGAEETIRSLQKSHSGQASLRVSPQNEWVAQAIPPEVMRPQRSQTLTFSGWVWSAVPQNTRLPIVAADVPGVPVFRGGESIPTDTEPRPFTFTVFIPQETGRVIVTLPAAETAVFYDDLALSAVSGENLLRNPSAEAAWFGSALEKNLGNLRIGGFNWSATLATLQEPQVSRALRERTFWQLIETFWGQPAKNYVPMLGGRRMYQMLAALTGALLLLGLAAWAKNRRISAVFFVWVGLGALSWFQTFTRGASELGNPLDFIVPYARYSAPVILISGWALASGWLQAADWLKKPQWALPGFLAFLFSLNLFALLSVLQFFVFPNGEIYLILFALVFSASLGFLLTQTSSPTSG